MLAVYVLNQHDKPLIPCHPTKARMLLKQGKAKIVQKTPFTIQLLYGSSGYKQPITLGVDSGYKHIGLSAVSKGRELFAGEVELRTDIPKLLQERRQYRRARRYRKWYRKPRFLNRERMDGWLAPSIQNKLNAHIRVIDQVKRILPITQVNVQVASFDIQKIKNPDIQGKDYQNGEQKGFWNTREYVLYRDNHICQYCKGKSEDKVLEVHHIIPESKGGTDKPDELVTLCRTCHQYIHKNHLEKEIQRKTKPFKQFKAETFMSMVRWKLIDKLRELGYMVSHTYGYITKSSRIKLGLLKSHVNDAFVIAGGDKQQHSSTYYNIKQVRKCNRKLFKANFIKGGRKKVNTTREAFGFKRFDKVLYDGVECFILGLRKTGYFNLRKLRGEKVSPSANYKKLKLLEKARTFLVAGVAQFPPCSKEQGL